MSGKLIEACDLSPPLHLIPPHGGGGRLGAGIATVMAKNGQVYAYLSRDPETSKIDILKIYDVHSGDALLCQRHGPPAGWKPADKWDEPPDLKAMALSEDGTLCATATSLDLRLWRVGSAEPVWAIDGGAFWLNFFDGLLWAFVRKPNQLLLWGIDVEDGALKKTHEFPYSPQHRLINGGLPYQRTNIELFDLNEGTSDVLFEVEERIGKFFLTSDATRLLISLKDTLAALLVDITSGEVITEFDLSEMPGPEGERTYAVKNPDLALSPCGQYAIIGSDLVWILDAESGELLRICDPRIPQLTIIMNATGVVGFVDEHILLYQYAWQLLKFDISTGEEITEGEIFPRLTTTQAWAPDGTKLLSAHAGCIYIWDLRQGEHRRIEVDHDPHWSSAAFSEDGRTAWVAGMGAAPSLLEIDVEEATVAGLSINAYRVGASMDGSKIAVAGDGGIRIFLGSLTGEGFVIDGGASDVRDLVFDSTGTRLAARLAKQLVVWDITDPSAPERLLKRGGQIQAMAVTEDRLLVLASSGAIQSFCFDGSKAETLFRKLFRPNADGAFSPCGRFVIGNTERGARVQAIDGTSAWKSSDEISLRARFSPDATQISVPLRDHSLGLLNLTDKANALVI